AHGDPVDGPSRQVPRRRQGRRRDRTRPARASRRADDPRGTLHRTSAGALPGRNPYRVCHRHRGVVMTVEISRLSNGLTVVTDTMPHVESVALGIWVKAGSRNERSDQHGIAHLLEHMVFKGTGSRSAWDIASQIENVGGEINAATSVETTAFYARVLKDDLPLAIEILADILTDSRFDPAELEREQHVILQEIGAAHDTPDDIVFDRFTETAFRHQA